MKEVFIITWNIPCSYKGKIPMNSKFDSYDLAKDKIAELLNDPDFSDYQFQIQNVFVKA